MHICEKEKVTAQEILSQLNYMSHTETQRKAAKINNNSAVALYMYLWLPFLRLSPVYKSIWGETHASAASCEWSRLL